MSGFIATRGGICPPHRHHAGYTLVEILTTTTLLAVLTTLAIQAGQVIRREISSAELNDLMAALSYARSTAIKTEQTITICKSSDGQHCGQGAAWNDGWITFIDRDRNRVIDPDDELLRVHEALPVGNRVHDGRGYYYYVIYKPDGSAWPNGTFTFCGPAGYRRAIILYRTGRARVSAVSPQRKTLDCSIS